MAFVYLGGDDSTRPTFFEAIAADKLLPSLKSALVYALSVFSQRHPWVHRLLDYEDELLALVLLLADWHSLTSTDATLAESLYGLRRRPLRRSADVAAPKQPGPSGAPSGAQKRASLLLEALIPYVRSKAQRRYRQLHQGVLSLALQRGAAQLAALPISASAGAPWGARARHAVARAFITSYPYLHAACDLVSLGYHLAYLSGTAPCHRPVLHALGLQLARVSAPDLEAMQRARQRQRAAALQACGPRPGVPAAAAAAARGVLHACHFASDHARHALILLVFGFKGLEWWFTSAEGRMGTGKLLPIPPPPPAPLPVPQGVGLSTDPACCPVCKQQTVNPAQVATSGYVGCYACVFAYITAHGTCPVTALPTRTEHVRKLYDAS